MQNIFVYFNPTTCELIYIVKNLLFLSVYILFCNECKNISKIERLPCSYELPMNQQKLGLSKSYLVCMKIYLFYDKT